MGRSVGGNMAVTIGGNKTAASLLGIMAAKSNEKVSWNLSDKN